MRTTKNFYCTQNINVMLCRKCELFIESAFGTLPKAFSKDFNPKYLNIEKRPPKKK